MKPALILKLLPKLKIASLAQMKVDCSQPSIFSSFFSPSIIQHEKRRASELVEHGKRRVSELDISAKRETQWGGGWGAKK